MSGALKHTEQAHAKYRDGEYEAALGLYEVALKTAKLPAHRIALHSNRAACYLKLKDYENASKECSAVLQLDPNHLGVLLLRAQTLQAMKDYKAALFDIGRLLELKPDSKPYLGLQSRLKTLMAKETELNIIKEEGEEEEEESSSWTSAPKPWVSMQSSFASSSTQDSSDWLQELQTSNTNLEFLKTDNRRRKVNRMPAHDGQGELPQIDSIPDTEKKHMGPVEVLKTEALSETPTPTPFPSPLLNESLDAKLETGLQKSLHPGRLESDSLARPANSQEPVEHHVVSKTRQKFKLMPLVGISHASALDEEPKLATNAAAVVPIIDDIPSLPSPCATQNPTKPVSIQAVTTPYVENTAENTTTNNVVLPVTTETSSVAIEFDTKVALKAKIDTKLEDRKPVEKGAAFLAAISREQSKESLSEPSEPKISSPVTPAATTAKRENMFLAAVHREAAKGPTIPLQESQQLATPAIPVATLQPKPMPQLIPPVQAKVKTNNYSKWESLDVSDSEEEEEDDPQPVFQYRIKNISFRPYGT